ncbi:hypothetical protein BJ165DRAFT_1530344 [Panaeolus papilionaceus]|nr:hypothetical protein BJ165DRAFT_1530344 [Panaeolus papilionaceus]
MTTLIIGGTGKTGLALAKLLHKASRPLLVTSRSGVAPDPFPAVAFNWSDPSTFLNPFNYITSNSTSTTLPPIDRTYIIGPAILDPLPVVQPFIELAVSKGVSKFVLLSASLAPPGEHFAGSVHQWFIDHGKEKGVKEWVVLRPPAFMQNFTRLYVSSIKSTSSIFSCAENGRVAFVHTDDIAEAAFEALTTSKYDNGQLYVVGPELYSYDEVAQLFTSVLQKPISHNRITPEAHTAIFTSFGMSPTYTEPLSLAEQAYNEGTEEAVFNAPEREKWIGKIGLREFVKANVGVWN